MCRKQPCPNCGSDAMLYYDRNTGVLMGVRRCEHTTLLSCLSWVRRNGLWGLIDREGNIIAEPIWELHDGAYARRSEAGWIELEVCVDLPEGEDTLFENEGPEPNEDLEQKVGSISYHIETRRVDKEACRDDDSAKKADPYDAIASIANELISGTFSDDDWNDNWDDDWE